MSVQNENLEAKRGMLKIDLQHFAEPAGGDNGGDNGGEENTATDTGTGTEGKTDNGSGSLSTEALDKLIQSRVDIATANLGKKIAELQKENKDLKNAGKSAEEIQKSELAEKDKALTEKEQALLERENRLYALKAIKEAELDDGGVKSLELAEFVIAGATKEEDIDKRVQAFKSLVNSIVEKKVDATFKKHGRNPNGSTGDNKGGETTNIAEKIGKERAERDKQSNDVLSMYTKRR